MGSIKRSGRRTFLKSLAWGSLSLVVPSPQSLRSQKTEGWRQKKGDMYYRRLGRTNFFISEVSLGGSPLPDWSLLRELIDRGVNYIDTSCSYSNGNSERQVGRLLKEVGRDQVIVATKFHLRGGWNEESIIRSAEASLRRLSIDCLDGLLVHGAEHAEDLVDERVLNAFDKLKKAGKYRFNGLSCHSDHQRVVRTAVDSGRYDMVQLGYNVFDIEDPDKTVETYEDYLGRSGMRDLIRYAAAEDVGIIAMKTLKVGGRRQNLENYKTGNGSLYTAMLKWVLENRNVAAAVTEMLNRQQMDEDLAAAGGRLAEEERQALFRYVAANSRDYCHFCGRCRTGCPSQISTTEILRFLAYEQSYGKTAAARSGYAGLAPGRTSLGCRDCGVCEKTCPYGVRVRQKIREAHEVLSG